MNKNYLKVTNMKSPVFKVKRCHPDATIPIYKHTGDSGMDVTSVEELIIEPMQRAMVDTGLKFVIPMGTEIQVRPRSGLSIKHGITVINSPATIDSSYSGLLKVLLVNLSNTVFKVEKGMRIAQIVFAPVLMVDKLEEVEDFEFITTRGENGFGSTGLN